MEWRAGPGRRDPATRRISHPQPQMWQIVISEMFGEGWRTQLRAFRSGGAASIAPTARVAPSAPAPEDDEVDELALDIFDAMGDDVASNAFPEGSWADKSDREVRAILESRLSAECTLQAFNRRILRARAILLLRRQPVEHGTVERTLANARILDAARSDPGRAVVHLEERL